MAEDKPVMESVCEERRSSCEKTRGLVSDNFALTLKSEMYGIIEKVLAKVVDDMKRQMDEELEKILCKHGIPSGSCGGLTAVEASVVDHPKRRSKDVTLRARAFEWLRENAVWCLVVLFALVAGNVLHPYAIRIMEALTKAIESWLK